MKMKIKSFIAPDIKNALDQIRKETGSSALILETCECKGQGFKGYLDSTMVEVIAAYYEDVADQVSEGGLEDVVENNDESVIDNVGMRTSQPKMLALLNERMKGKKVESDVAGTKVKDNVLKPEDINPEPVKPFKAIIEMALETTIETPIKTRDEEISVKSVNSNSLHPAMEQMRAYLLDQEVRNETVDLLLNQRVSARNAKEVEDGKPTIDKIKTDVRNRIADMVSIKNILGINNEPGRKIITFVGPTGVGKTTTLAKVAAKLAIDNEKSVGVITVDTYRIAAVDQLMAYTDMIDIPVRVSHTPKELSVAVNEFEDKDFILIDTVGRSQYDKKRIRMLRGLLKILPSPENYLVMNAGTRNREADDIFDNFNILPLSGFIFTKTDETRRFGMLLNMVAKTKMPICCLTNGQEVPDDIVEVSPEGIADLLIPS
ncbi:MAG: flagellar biosynthesis protein FlhF [Candidatus Anammoxibacter sp.]